MVTDYIPESQGLAMELEKSSLFERVHCIGKIHEYIPKNKLDYIFNQHTKNAKLIEAQLDVSLKEYNEIYIFHDDTWFAHYLKCAKIPYNLVEDALNSFKVISKTPFAYMLHKVDFKAWIKNTFRIGYVFCGYDHCTKSVEVNSNDGIEIKRHAGKKLTQLPRKPLFDSLTTTELEKLGRIFLRDIPVFCDRNSILLITQPLFEDGCLTSATEQITIYKKLVAKHSEGYSLVIKPHPRDNANYYAAFPRAVILDKNMPLEIIALISKPHFAKIISAGSTCLKVITADEYITTEIKRQKTYPLNNSTSS